MIKPSVYVILIAVIIAEIVCCLLKKQTKWQHLLLQAAVILIMLAGAEHCQRFMVDRIGLDINETIEIGAAEYFYMGLNEETTGSYSGDGMDIVGEFQFTDRKEREYIAFQRALGRMEEKGFWGMLSFWLRKQVMTFNDATYGWDTEVWIHDYYSPVVSTDTPFMTFLREIYWTGSYVGAYNTLMQLIWIYCLLGIPGMLLPDRKEKSGVILTLCFMGVFFYQMLFEARARYLFVFLPLLLVCATYGMYRYSGLWERAGRFVKSLKTKNCQRNAGQLNQTNG